MTFRRLALALFSAATLTLTACSGGNPPVPPAGGNAELGTTSDVNPRDPATLRDGGDLRLALSGYPPNFNDLHIDGNLGEIGAMYKAVMPRAFTVAPDGTTRVNTDFFTNVELTGTSPQRVTYTINPKAVWSDGAPITWADIASQISATSGKDKRFLIAAPNGSERVASVTRGVDDRQAVMTFAKPYTDWRGMFAGNGILFPKVMTATPEAFNTGFLNGPPPTAGPFVISTVDRAAQRIVLTRNPKWWGRTPRLNSITYTVLDDAARLPALQNGALDATGLASLDELTIARRTPGIALRRAPAAQWYHFTFNGAPGSVLADEKLRAAIAKGIDRQAIAAITQRGLADDPKPLGNHVYVAGEQGYQDNATPFDPDGAKRDLDALGWKTNGQFRERDGQRLRVRDVFYDAQTTRQIGQIAQNNLAQIGVDLVLTAAPGGSLFSEYITPGNFDIAQFSWAGDAFPLGGLTQIYASDGESNFGKIGNAEIDAKIEQTLSELDAAKARGYGNEVDRMLWAEAFSLPLFQSTGNVAVRANLANFGPAGVGDLDYTAIGFMP